MRNSRIAMLALLTTGFLYAGQARAALLTFDFTGTDPGASSSWTQTSELDSNLQITTGLHIVTPRNNATNPSTGMESHHDDNAFSFTTNYGNSGKQSIATAISNNYWISFTIAPKAGYELNLNDATINLTLTMGDTTNGPTIFPLFTSVGGFADGDELNNNKLSGPISTPISFAVNLPSSGYDQLTAPLEIRILPANGQYNGKWVQINALSIDSGSVTATIPEPTTAALAVAGAIPLLLRRRRR